jgi:hypothetical protein
MKKTSVYIGILLTLVMFSCKKKDNINPLADVKNLGIGSYLTKTSDINRNLDYQNGNSKVGITVTEYKGSGSVDKIVLYVVQGASSNPADWKKIKEIPYTGDGTEISATEQDVATALGLTPADLPAGSSYTFYNQIITKDGRTFDLSNSPGAIESSPNYNDVFRWSVVITCPYVRGLITGDYTVVQDDWADWSPGDVVHVDEVADADQINISKVWPNPAYGAVVDPLIVDIDPANGVATIPLVTFGDYGAPATAETPDDGAAGYVFSCTGYIGLNILLHYNGSSQGNLKLTLQKN